MKYYLYVSATKVDMLYPQIPKGVLDRIAGELKLDLKVVSASVSINQKKSEETLYSKLQCLVAYIEKYCSVGIIDDPDTYFRGTLSMFQGEYGDAHGYEVIFWGGTTNHSILGLGGSINHLIFPQGASAVQVHSGSNTGHLLAVLERELPLKVSRYAIYQEEIQPVAKSGPLPGNITTDQYLEKAAMDAVYIVVDNMGERRPAHRYQKLEFLAKRLLQGHSAYDNRNIILGTPIYVAKAD